jgi:3-hydroxyacyl-CoA dehydrogenase/enoyl-CoA hydratase/3-hydroxybutyryl-CoA epimerase
VTRVLFFYLNEAVRLWEEGGSTETIDAALRAFGWPMGPLRLIDEVGIDVTDFIFGEMAHYFPERFVRTSATAQLLAAGLRGRKNGAGVGFYRYEGKAEAVNVGAQSCCALAVEGRSKTAPLQGKEISNRLMSVMIAEARRCLAEGVVKSPDDIDFALLSGAGFPAWRGGLMRYAATIAPASCPK